MLAHWTALGPRLQASEVFRRYEAGGRVGVLMSVVDEEEGPLGTHNPSGLKLVQASNPAYDQLLLRPRQNLRTCMGKRCLLAILMGWCVRQHVVYGCGWSVTDFCRMHTYARERCPKTD